MADAVGNIHVALYVDTGNTRKFTTAATIIGRDSQRIRTALGSTSRSVTQLQTQMGMGLRTRLFTDMMRQATTTNNELGKLRATMMGLAAITGTSLTGAMAGTWLLHTADRANLLNNQLRTVTDSSEELLATQKRLYDLSQESRAGMESTVKLYARMARAAEFFGLSQTDLIRVTETVQKAFAIGGASQAEAMGAAVQLSQGIASDRFSGEEYRSVAENAPVLLQEMARGLGVTIGKLREMAHAGELTGKVVTSAILGASEAIDKDFAKTNVTVGQSMTRVGNAFLMYIGESDKAFGVTRRLSDALSSLAENFEEIAYWGAAIAGLGLAVFGGKMASAGTKGIWSSIVPTGAERLALRDALKDLAAQRTAIKREMDQTRNALAVASPASGIGPTRPDQFARVAAERNQSAIDRALKDEVRARQVINDLQVDHLIATDKLNTMRANGIAKLQKEVVVAKDRNAADAVKVGLVQKALAAEKQRLEANRRLRIAFTPDADKHRAIYKEPLTSKALSAGIAAEAKAMAAFDKSLGTLQAKMQAFSAATTSAFDNPATRKLAGQIGDLDRKLATAQKRLVASSNAVTQAYAGDARLLAVAQQERASAVAHMNALQTRANILTAQGAALVNRLTVANKALAAAQRVGASILSFVGGPVGVAFLAAIASIGYMSGEMAKAEERTVSLKKELNELGLISDELAGITDKAAKSLDDLAADELRNKLRQIFAEIDARSGEQNPFMKMFAYDPQMLGNMETTLNQLLAGFKGAGLAMLSEQNVAAAQALRTLIQRARDGSISVEDLTKNLDELAAANPGMDDWLDKIISDLRQVAPFIDGLTTRAKQLQDQLDKIGKGSDAGWLMEHFSKTSAMDAQDAALSASLKNLADISAEMLRIAGLTPDQSRLEEQTDKIVKAWEDINEETEISSATIRVLAEEQAKLVIAAENAAEQREKEAEAAKDLADKVQEIQGQLGADGFKLVDRDAGDVISGLLEDFKTGNLRAETLTDRLQEIKSVNLSESMNELIDRILAAIPALSTLLGVYNQFPGATSGPARGRGAVGRARRELDAKMGLGQGVATDAIRIAGLSDRDAFVEDKMKELTKSAKELGGVLPAAQARKAAEELWKLDQAADSAGRSQKDAAKASEKFAEGMAELRNEASMANLDEFFSDVVSEADGMGIAADEIEAFIAAVSSGGLDAAPQKFKDIAAAMREISSANIMKDLTFEFDQMSRSDTDQRIFDTLRGTGIDASDPYGQIIAGQIRLNETMKTGKEIASDFFGGILHDLADGASFTDALGNAFTRLGSRLLDIATETLVTQLFANLAGSLFGGSSFGSPAGGGWSGSLGGLWDDGGYTGPGGRKQPAGIVHKGEVVWSQDDIRNAGGVGVVEAMRRGLRGYAEGGMVARDVPQIVSTGGMSSMGAITYAPQIDARGADAAAVARLEKALIRDRQNFEARVVGVIQAGPRGRYRRV